MSTISFSNFVAPGTCSAAFTSPTRISTLAKSSMEIRLGAAGWGWGQGLGTRGWGWGLGCRGAVAGTASGLFSVCTDFNASLGLSRSRPASARSELYGAVRLCGRFAKRPCRGLPRSRSISATRQACSAVAVSRRGKTPATRKRSARSQLAPIQTIDLQFAQECVLPHLQPDLSRRVGHHWVALV